MTFSLNTTIIKPEENNKINSAIILFHGYGGDGIEFIEKLFEDTHYIGRSYHAQGFVILFPVTKEMDDNLLVGSAE